MDFAAIADVHSIKRQIQCAQGPWATVAVRGHNVKLGRGGIREIEFFVQTQQLIAGGRFEALRGRENRWPCWPNSPRRAGSRRRRARHSGRSTGSCATSNTRCRWFADEQTHVLPEDDEGLERIACMLRFASADEFATAFRKSLHLVESHYAALFETAPELSSGVGNLVFTGDVDDPDTMRTLEELGFERPSDIARIIRTWHFGRYRATQSAEARERLTELTPALLLAFGQTKRADEALLAVSTSS